MTAWERSVLKTKFTTETVENFENPVSNPNFTVYNIGEKAGKYKDKVSVSWTNSQGTNPESLVMTWSELKELNEGQDSASINDWNVFIDDTDVTSITVKLENDIPEDAPKRRKAKVELDTINYDGPAEVWPCLWLPEGFEEEAALLESNNEETEGDEGDQTVEDEGQQGNDIP